MQGKAINLSRTPRQAETAPFRGDFTPPEKFGAKLTAESFDRRRNGTAGLAAIRPAPPGPSLADEAFLEGLRRGMPDAIEVLFNRYRAKVYNLAMSIVKNESDAEEVTQDVLLTVIRKVDTFKGNSAFYSWIYRICVNASLIRIRERRRPDTVSIEEFMPVFTEDGMHAHPVDDWSKEIERKALDKELGRMIRKFTSHLPEKYRVVFILSEVEGLSNEETAQVLNLTLPAVKSRLHRARLYLRGRLSVYLRDGLSE
jgi:RNA polymerase sigma-70 factor (ECF subfamily)